jgi:Flp pilus assembly protein TadD
VECLAILPFENLSGDPGLDWASRASSAILAYDLTGPKQIHPIRVESLRDARLSDASQYLEGYFAKEHGILKFHTTLENSGAVKIERTQTVTAQTNDLVVAMNQLAKSFETSARSFPHCSEAALQSYGVSIADPTCLPAYLPLVEATLARGDREGAARLAATALALPGVDPIDRAQLEYLSATAKNDSDAKLQSLKKLVELLPADPELLRSIGEQQVAKRDFPAAVKSLEAATQTDPGDPQTWNLLGYARADMHDLKGAMEALQHYQSMLPPEESNGLDSMGEVSFYLGDFASAERYFFKSYQKNESAGVELLKAAEAHLMTGDLPGADRLLAQKTNWRSLSTAQWEFLTGRRKQAIARLESQPADPGTAVQLDLWKAQTGTGPVPENPNEPLGHAVALLLNGKFADATPVLEAVYRATSPDADGAVRTMLAWSYVQTGRSKDAAPLLDRYPIPLGSNEPNILASLTFPKFVELRGEVLHSDQDRQLAKRFAAAPQ